MDKWLWAARFFKTRSMATKACELSRVDWNGQTAKPAREVRVGDRVRIQAPGGVFEVEVLELGDVRGPAAVAQKMYVESEASKEARAKAAAERKAMGMFLAAPATKPSKRDRRVLLRMRGRG